MTKNNLFWLLFLTATPYHTVHGKHLINDREVINQMLTRSKQSPKIYLLSYPRSGNTWFRYWLEVLTQRATAHYQNLENLSNLPIGLMVGHRLDYSKAPAWKIHGKVETNFAGLKCDQSKDYLILCVRNPKEAILRHLGGFRANCLTNARHGQFNYVPHVDGELNNVAWYFDNLRIYDGWNPTRRLLIYYEDMIKSPANVFAQVVKFLGDSPSCIVGFMDNYTYHKQMALKVYGYNGGSQTQGDSAIFHSQRLSKADREKIDRFMKTHYQQLWSKYLGHRYSEAALAVRSLLTTDVEYLEDIDLLEL